MVQNVQISNVSQLDSLWSGTVLPIPDFSKFAAEGSVYSTQSIGISILGLLLFFVFFGEFFFKLISKICVSFLYPRDMMKINEGVNLNIGFSFLFLLACPISVSLLIRYEVLPPSLFPDIFPMINFLFYSLFILGFFMLRKFILFVLGVVTNHSEDFGVIFKYSVSFFIIIAILSLTPLPFAYLMADVYLILARVILFSVIGILTIGYLFQIGRIIISSQISIFFSFLYLCTLEILPLILMTYTVINLD